MSCSQGLAGATGKHRAHEWKWNLCFGQIIAWAIKELHSVSRHACSLSFYNDFNLFIVGAMVFHSLKTILNKLKYVEQLIQLKPAGAHPFHQPLHFLLFSFHFTHHSFIRIKTSMSIESLCFIEHAFQHCNAALWCISFRCSNQFQKTSDTKCKSRMVPHSLCACKQNTDFYTAHWANEMLISGSHKSWFHNNFQCSEMIDFKYENWNSMATDVKNRTESFNRTLNKANEIA